MSILEIYIPSKKPNNDMVVKRNYNGLSMSLMIMIVD